MPLDKKLELCLEFVIRQYQNFVENPVNAGQGKWSDCFVVGISGCQGCGKTTLASTLASTLTAKPYNLPTLTISIDQFYLTHEAQASLACSLPSNDLIQSRGQPSTHDLPLAMKVLTSIRQGCATSIPWFDKSACGGEGDREPATNWQTVNAEQDVRVKILILEGWCIGFKALSTSKLMQKWASAHKEFMRQSYHSRLAQCKLSSLFFINSALANYEVLTELLDCLIHLDAQNPQSVYEWRLQQEHALWKSHGAGMSDDDVVQFVDKYYPAYELYAEGLRSNISHVGCQRLRLLLDTDRQLLCLSDDVNRD